MTCKKPVDIIIIKHTSSLLSCVMKHVTWTAHGINIFGFLDAPNIMLLCFPTFTEALSIERPTQLIHGTCKSHIHCLPLLFQQLVQMLHTCLRTVCKYGHLHYQSQGVHFSEPLPFSLWKFHFRF